MLISTVTVSSRFSVLSTQMNFIELGYSLKWKILEAGKGSPGERLSSGVVTASETILAKVEESRPTSLVGIGINAGLCHVRQALLGID